MPDNTVQFTSSYVFSKDPELAFPVVKSNYESVLRQSRTNYKKMLELPGGREAVQTMVDRDKTDNHFRILTSKEFELN